jgi:ABC-type branched-subunit amino acid transport system substrate-binding protein
MWNHTLVKGARIALVVAASTGVAIPAGTASAGLRVGSLDRLGSTSNSTEVVVPRGQPVEVALADDLTGSASFLGVGVANAVQMAVDAHPDIRGFPIQINFVNAPCGDPTADVAAAMSIVANMQNAGVIGQLCSTGFDQALPIYQSADVVTINGSTTDPSLPPFGPDVFNSVTVHDSCCPFVDEFDPWYETVLTLPSDLAWQQAYSLQFGTAPTAFADLYYDAASLLIRDVQNTSSIDGSGNLLIDRAALAHAVRNTTRYQGVTCKITIDPAIGYRINDPTALSRCAG